jgi:hypothetical protein
MLSKDKPDAIANAAILSDPDVVVGMVGNETFPP